MSPITDLPPHVFASLASILFVPVEKHVNLVYVGLALVFALVLAYMFLYNRKH